jgi:CRISPR-associated protein Csd1
MIRELSDLGKRLREENSKDRIVHDAIKDEAISIDMIIDSDGTFVRFEVIEKVLRPAEAITAKKGKARLLLDKAEEVLGYNEDEKKHGLFIEKLNEYKGVKSIDPVFLFYGSNKAKGFKKALTAFEKEVSEKERNGNIAFRVQGKDIRIHENKEIYNEIITRYESKQSESLLSKKIKCSICGKDDYPVVDMPHGMIKRVPDGQVAGCVLVSYNGDHNPFESYGMKGNENSSICTNCAKTYVEGLNWLLSNGVTQKADEKKKEYFKYSNRKNFGSDTAMVFWTKQNQQVAELDLLDAPDVGQVSNLIDSVTSGGKKKTSLEIDQFYSCTLSGAAARIAVRDWIEVSLFDIQKSIAQWFKDIEIGSYDSALKKIVPHYSRIYDLARASQNEKEKNDVTLSRVAVSLWKAAIENKTPPIWILSSVLKRIKVDTRGITPERASLLRLIINRNTNGGNVMKESLDEKNDSTAYICGRIFCVLENIQRAALGKTNAGIRERFFSSASTNPSSAFGRLLKMSQNHISKIRGEKPGLAVFFDKEMQELFAKIGDFPAIFSLEDQGRFAIGYYHQKHDTFRKAAANKDLKDAIDPVENNNKKGE